MMTALTDKSWTPFLFFPKKKGWPTNARWNSTELNDGFDLNEPYQVEFIGIIEFK